MTKRKYLTIVKVLRGFTGRGGWGYNEVEMSNGKRVYLRQDNRRGLWKKGDKVPAGRIKRLKSSVR